MGKVNKEIKNKGDKKQNPSRLEKLLLKGPTWTEEQYQQWLKDSKSLHKWQIR